jgi:uncharacterized membrane protein
MRWDAATNTSTMLDTPGTIESRANGISVDGSIVYGYYLDPALGGQRAGALWLNGALTPLTYTATVNGNPVTRFAGEANNSTTDGSVVVGGSLDYDLQASDPFWRWTPTGGLEFVAGMPGFGRTLALATNRDGSVIAGYGQGLRLPTGDFDNGVRSAFIWTPRLGLMPLKDFLTLQGIRTPDIYSLGIVNAVSANGTRLVGSGILLPNGTQVGWILDINRVKVCHAPQSSPGKTYTMTVSFPEGMDEHLAHGDTFGPCPRALNGSGRGN